MPENRRSSRFLAWLRRHSLLITAILLIAVWALFFSRAYINFDPKVIPGGREFNSAIQAHHLWTRFEQCGLCALWDGSERGGFPAFVDTLASSLHPLVVITTLFFGVVNGSKVSLIIAFMIAGIAQLWLGGELKLGWPARVWGALMVMVGGHLAGKMELGLFSIVLATTMYSLTLPAALRLARTRRYRDAVLFAIILALFAVSGQGYLQVGFLLMSPAYLALLVGRRRETGQLWSRFLLAAGLALLLAAPFIVPLIHFWPNFLKDGDTNFGAAQPLAYYVLNLVIDDFGYLTSEVLGKLPYPHLYTMFIGWIPLLFAALCLRYARRADRRPLLFLASSAVLAIFVGSMIPLKWLVPLVSSLSILRFAPMIGALAVPALIGLAAFGLDRLLRQKWLRPTLYLNLGSDAPQGHSLDLRWLLIIPMALALVQGYRFTQEWLYVVELEPAIDELLNNLETPGLAWVQPPFGEHAYIEPAVNRGLKLSPGIMTWRWNDRDFPEPELEANRYGPPPKAGDFHLAAGVPVYETSALPYATVVNDQGRELCSAEGTGGILNVACANNEAGILVVLENQWSGWYAWQDGEPIPLDRTQQWLTVSAPAGEHRYTFRYLPWDVPFGFFLFLFGVAACIYFWRQDEDAAELHDETVGAN
ncbi:MAG: hypothetical protein R3293_10235 [Candidatus Promineifilaceae bacterium]|nr:hypothetical protein [Candidatus Promineifilaceae bacterium]